MSEWIEYTGSDEQIAEIEAAFQQNGFIVAKENGGISEIIQGSQPLSKGFVSHNFNTVWSVKKYLVCHPHPRADMICKQARTGQPVWVRGDGAKDVLGNPIYQYVMHGHEINWNLTAEYSFTEFKEE